MKFLERTVFFFARVKYVIVTNIKLFIGNIRKAVKEELKKWLEDKYTGTEPTE